MQARARKCSDVDRETTAPNAESVGFDSTRRVILWNTLLDGRFSRGEVRVVVAHELGHIAHKHILKDVGWLALFLLPAAGLVALFTRPRGGLARPQAVPVALFVFVVLQLLTVPLMNIVSRRQEAEADWSALRATRDPAAARALFADLARTSLANPDPPTWSYVLFDNHPTIVQRMAMVEAWQARQARQVRRCPHAADVRAFGACTTSSCASSRTPSAASTRAKRRCAAILVPWVKEEWFEEGEQKWNSNEATITVLEGPKLSMPELAMGRGWRNAQRRSEDVTERVLAAVRQAERGRGRAGCGSDGCAPSRRPARVRKGRAGLLKPRRSRPAAQRPTRGCSPTRSRWSCWAWSTTRRWRWRRRGALAAQRLGDALSGRVAGARRGGRALADRARLGRASRGAARRERRRCAGRRDGLAGRARGSRRGGAARGRELGRRRGRCVADRPQGAERPALDSGARGGRSSVGRAPGCGPGGRGFKSRRSPSRSAG